MVTDADAIDNDVDNDNDDGNHDDVVDACDRKIKFPLINLESDMTNCPNFLLEGVWMPSWELQILIWQAVAVEILHHSTSDPLLKMHSFA